MAETMMHISADDLLYEAWSVIANAGWDGADKSEGWQEAAVRWRDKWHAYLWPERRLTPADVLELARSLEGAEVVDTQVMSVDGFSRCVIPVNWMKRGRYLVIPLPEGEER